MIPTLMVEGMPLTTTDKLTLSAIHHPIGISKRECRSHLRLLTPSTCRPVDGIMSIPVINILSPLTGKDTLISIQRTLSNIIRPVIKHIIVLFHSC